MAVEDIHLDRRGKVALVTIDRPERRNAFNRHLLERLSAVTAQLKSDLPRAVVITGSGDAFSAGFDVNPDNPLVADLMDSLGKKDPGPAHAAITWLRSIVDAFVALPVPIIAAVNGLAYGGGAELSTRCDLRVMDPDAAVCFSEVRLGLMPDWGGGATLAHLLGAARAADLILTARKVGAKEALALGWANRVSKPGNVLEEALVMADMIAKNGPRSVRYALEVIRQSRSLPMARTLDLEAERAVDLIVSGECMYGVGAFLEKKEPEFPDIKSDIESD